MRPMTDEHFAILRRHMVEKIGIHSDLMGDELGKTAFDERVLAAMLKVPRHLFVPAPLAHVAYEDSPLPIGFNKTISQPFITALMTDLLAPEPHETVLEIGTGLGYHAALLAELAGRVFSVEIVEEFADEAQSRLRQTGYHAVEIRVGDGSRGWAEHAPYDKIMVTAAANEPPRCYSNNSSRAATWFCLLVLMKSSSSRSSTRMVTGESTCASPSPCASRGWRPSYDGCPKLGTNWVMHATTWASGSLPYP